MERLSMLERHMRRVKVLADAYENEAIIMSTGELEAIYDDDVFEAMELQNREVEMLGIVAGNITASSSSFSIHYVPAKLKHECTHCGFDADLYESSGEYECPICRRGTMCRPTQDLIWYQDCNSSWAALQQGFYGPAEVPHRFLDTGAPSAPIYDGYLFEEV